MKKGLAALLILLAAGCAGTRGRVAGPAVPGPLRSEIVASLVARNAALNALRGEATVRYGGKVFGARGETAFALSRPGRLRIDGLAEFGVYSSQLALSGNALTILWPSDNRYFSGAASPEAFARYVLIGLPSETIVNILAGAMPVRADDPGLRVAAKGRGVFIVRGERVESVVEARGSDYVPLRYTVTDLDGAPIYQVNFAEYEKSDGTPWFANKMTARFWDNGPSRTKARIEVTFKDLEINPKLDDKLFELKVPKDAERVSD